MGNFQSTFHRFFFSLGLSETLLKEIITVSKNLGKHFKDNLGIGKEYKKIFERERAFIKLYVQHKPI